MTTVSPTATAEDRWAATAAYGLIAQAFRDPDREWRTLLTTEARWDDWPGRLAALEPELATPLNRFREACRALHTDPEWEMIVDRYAALFGPAVRGTCPPYELEYGASEIIQRASDLADISGFYAAFGLTRAPTAHERMDHITMEMEFLAVLCAKAAWGLEQGLTGLTEAAVAAQRRFMQVHVSQWIPAFTRRVMDADGGGFYGRLAVFVDAWITAECRRLEVTPGSAYVSLRPVDPEEESAQSCGVPGAAGETPFTPLTVNAGSRKTETP